MVNLGKTPPETKEQLERANHGEYVSKALVDKWNESFSDGRTCTKYKHISFRLSVVDEKVAIM